MVYCTVLNSTQSVGTGGDWSGDLCLSPTRHGEFVRLSGERVRLSMELRKESTVEHLGCG